MDTIWLIAKIIGVLFVVFVLCVLWSILADFMENRG